MHNPLTPNSLQFLTALAANNSKDWFTAHKTDYQQQLQAPCLALIAALAEPMQAISPQMVANPKSVGGSLFRIYRDTRFATDKTPYKTHAGISIYHAATKGAARSAGGNAAMGRLDAPVFYLHLQPGASFAGGGLWHPQPDTLKRIRSYMVNNPASWQTTTRSPQFSAAFGPLQGERLQRPPAGFDPQHPLIDDLKRKDFVCSAALSDAQVLAADFPAQLIALYQTAAPLLDWLCGALDLDF